MKDGEVRSEDREVGREALADAPCPVRPSMLVFQTGEGVNAMPLSVYQRQEIIPADDARPALPDVPVPVDQLRLVARVVGPDGREHPLPPKLVDRLQTAMRSLVRGKSLVTVPGELEVTTGEAADFLNLPWQYLGKLLNGGEIPFTKSGTRRRIKFGDLVRYKEPRDAETRQALRDLTHLSEEMGLYDRSAPRE